MCVCVCVCVCLNIVDRINSDSVSMLFKFRAAYGL